MDLSDCDLAIFVGCETGTSSVKSLPHAAVKAGAQVAIGFEESINCDEANDWTDYFFQYYRSGYSAVDSASRAAYDCGNDNGIDSYRVVTQ